MSVFEPSRAYCPSCGAAAEVLLARSVNAARSPEIRDSILAGSFQAVTCTHCQTPVQLPPELTYMDLSRQQWLVVYPLAREVEWEVLEEEVLELFALAFGPDSPPPARALAEGISPRLVFGWEGLREKLLAAEAGLDDSLLEVLKVAILYNHSALIDDDTALRLAAAGEEDLQLSLQTRQDGLELARLTVPRAAYTALADDPEPWAALRARISGPAFVDVLRTLAPQEASAEV